VLSGILLGCDGLVKVNESVLHLSIESEPTGGDVYWRISSTTTDVKSSNRLHLGMTPYRGTKTLNIPGLTFDNASSVSVVIIVEKEGYHEKSERYNLASVLNDLEISSKFKLTPKR